MPLYSYRCDDCYDMYEIRHGFYEETKNICTICEGKLNKFYGNVVVAASCMPTRSNINFDKSHEKESLQAKDMAAYKRLRKEGLQPRGIDGSSHLEKHAESKYEIKAGKTFREAKHAHKTEKLLNDALGVSS